MEFIHHEIPSFHVGKKNNNKFSSENYRHLYLKYPIMTIIVFQRSMFQVHSMYHFDILTDPYPP